MVARSWVDPDFREWLQQDATAAIASLGFEGRQGEHMVAVEQTDDTRNMVVCTLCSCYPWPVRGLPATNAHGLGEQPEWLYTVVFDAADLWDDARAGHYVSVDAWESYLRPVEEGTP